MIPGVRETGRLPAVWDGRTAETEEKRLRDSGRWESGREAFFQEWGRVDPAAAIKASRVTDRDSLTVSTAAAVAGWATADAAAARAWVSSQPENAERSAYVQAILETAAAGGLPKPTPGETAAWLGGELALPGIGPAVISFVTGWAAADRDAAAQWTADTVGDPALRAGIYEALMQWPAAPGQPGDFLARTAQWLRTRPEGPGRDELFFAFVKEASPHDAATSARWASLIQDENLRTRALKICADAGRLQEPPR
ncbi:MAG: hypothetical protein V4726_24155 [Verrucomicrobiota bacterium]